MPSANQARSFNVETPQPLELRAPVSARARDALVARLSDIVSWPETKVPLHERQLAADILVGLLRTSRIELRQRCARGLAAIHEAPKGLLRYVARDEISVSGPLLENGVGFDESDLIATVRAGVAAHWLAIARRRNVGEAVTDVLAQTGDVAVIEAVLRNQSARLSVQGVDLIVARSRGAGSLAALLAGRSELKPTQALVLFWWSDFNVRLQILRRFAVDRGVLIQELGDVFALAAGEGWSDADTRKALQVVERRQRNRAAAAKSIFGSLEGALSSAEQKFDQTLINEIAHLSGIKPTTASQIFADVGGEAIAVFCKAVGLKRPSLIGLWRALGRPLGDPDQTDNTLGRTCYVFDTLATAKAQTVLRYWNWSFTADAVALDRVTLEVPGDDVTLARRNAALLLRRGL